MATLINSCCKVGFREILINKEPKTDPIPTPAPDKPIVANPAPKNFDDCNNIRNFDFNGFVHLIGLWQVF